MKIPSNQEEAKLASKWNRPTCFIVSLGFMCEVLGIIKERNGRFHWFRKQPYFIRNFWNESYNNSMQGHAETLEEAQAKIEEGWNVTTLHKSDSVQAKCP